MREIIFRGKTVRGDEWVEGSFVCVGEYCCIIPSDSDKDPNMYLDSSLGFIDGCAVPVAPITVCMYTGLKDKNGNKIFEDDIVKRHSDGQLAVVNWEDASWILCNWYDDMFDDDFVANWCNDHYYYGENIGGCVVVGNTHDDYQLLLEEK